METGLLGVLLLASFLLWLTYKAIKIWMGDTKSRLGPLRQASVLALFVVLLHSFVDYPVRTGTISVLCAICLALMFAEGAAPIKKKTRKDLKI